MLTRNTVVLAKIEESYGTDPAPTSTADAILALDLDIGPVGETVERDFLKGRLSPLPFRRGVKSVAVSFRTELKGSGVKGALPSRGWEGVLFRACGMSETLNPETGIVYSPASSAFESCALYVYRDRIFHRVLGCRGSVAITVEAGKPAMADWSFKGLYLSPVDASPAPQSFSGVLPPVAVQAGFMVGGFSPVARRLEVNLNNTVVERWSLAAENGIAGFEITGRKPRGSMDPETVPESVHPFWSNWETAASMPLSLSLGTAAGNRLHIEAPAVQYREIGYADMEGRSVYAIPFSLAMSAGDDELTVMFE